MPQSADLSASRGTGESDLDVPFRAARGWHSPAWQLGDGRQCRWPVRADRKVGTALSAHRSQPAGRTWVPDEAGDSVRALTRPGPGHGTLPPGRPRRSLSAAGDRDLCAGSGADQPQARVPVFLGTDRSLSARGVRDTPRTICLPWCVTDMRTRLQIGDPAGQSGEGAHRRRRRLRSNHNGHPVSFNIDVQPVRSDGEELLLVCFVDEPKHEQKRGRAATQRDLSQVAELEQELKVTENGTARRHPQPGDFRRRAEGDQRRSTVRQRGISIDERGAADVEGGIAVAQ